MSEKISRHEAAKMLHISEGELRKLCNEHLTYRHDYFMHRKDGTQITADGIGILKEVLHDSNHEELPDTPRNDIYLAEEDEVVYGRVCATLPPNHRRIWITVDGFDGKQLCNVPLRLAKRYRVPRKRIPVRHVDGNVFQLAKVKIHE